MKKKNKTIDVLNYFMALALGMILTIGGISFLMGGSMTVEGTIMFNVAVALVGIRLLQGTGKLEEELK